MGSITSGWTIFPSEWQKTRTEEEAPFLWLRLSTLCDNALLIELLSEQLFFLRHTGRIQNSDYRFSLSYLLLLALHSLFSCQVCPVVPLFTLPNQKQEVCFRRRRRPCLQYHAPMAPSLASLGAGKEGAATKRETQLRGLFFHSFLLLSFVFIFQSRRSSGFLGSARFLALLLCS